MMTAKQRILAAYGRDEVDRPPVCPNFIRWIRGHYGCPCELHQLRCAQEFGFDPLIMYGMYLNQPISSDYVYRPDAAGGYRDLPDVNVDIRVENRSDQTIHIRRFETPDGVLTDRIVWARPGVGYGDGPNPHRDEPLVKSLSDVPALRHLYPAGRKGFVEDLRLFSQVVGSQGLVEYLEASNAGSWGMESLGPEQMLISSIENKGLLRAVLRVCQDQHLRNLTQVLDSGHKHIAVSWFQCGPSVGWSPESIQEFFLPLIRESVDLVHRYGGTYRSHDDGKMAALVPHLVDIGVDVIGSLQPPPVGDCILGELKEAYGDRACFLGGLDTVYAFELGTPEKVRSTVRELLGQIGDGRGVVISAGEAFGPETPAECLRELTRVVRECWPSPRS